MSVARECEISPDAFNDKRGRARARELVNVISPAVNPHSPLYSPPPPCTYRVLSDVTPRRARRRERDNSSFSSIRVCVVFYSIIAAGGCVRGGTKFAGGKSEAGCN